MFSVCCFILPSGHGSFTPPGVWAASGAGRGRVAYAAGPLQPLPPAWATRAARLLLRELPSPAFAGSGDLPPRRAIAIGGWAPSKNFIRSRKLTRGDFGARRAARARPVGCRVNALRRTAGAGGCREPGDSRPRPPAAQAAQTTGGVKTLCPQGSKKRRLCDKPTRACSH